VPKGLAAAGTPPWRSRTPSRRGVPIGASGRARRQAYPTTRSPPRSPGPRVDPVEGWLAGAGSCLIAPAHGEAPEGPAPSWR
jgi:hypothetical protein